MDIGLCQWCHHHNQSNEHIYHIYCICIFVLTHYSLVNVSDEEGSKIQALNLLKPMSDEGALKEIKSMFAFSEEAAIGA